MTPDEREQWHEDVSVRSDFTRPSDPAREARYAEAIRPHTSESHAKAERPTGCWCKVSLPDGEWAAHLARAVMAVADDELASLTAERDEALQGLWDTWEALGHDTDGDSGPGAWIAGSDAPSFIASVVKDAAAFRHQSEEDYDADTDALEAKVRAAEAEVRDLRTTVSRLNKRAQVAEAAVNELANGTGKGKAKAVSAEVWARCQETHGLVCPAARDLRAKVAAVEVERDEAIAEVASCDRAELGARIAKAKALHREVTESGSADACRECGALWPCPTVLTLSEPTTSAALLHCRDCDHTFTPSEAWTAGTLDVEDCPKCTIDEAVEVVGPTEPEGLTPAVGRAIKEANDESDRRDYAAWLRRTEPEGAGS